jgi:hypothetical protein
LEEVSQCTTIWNAKRNMILISHRGNLSSKSKDENHPDHIETALAHDFDVEIDVWKVNEVEWYLGHDEPQYRIDFDFLQNDKLWCHAKNIDALYGMMVGGVHCFWHQKDAVTLTSKGYLWNYPNTQITNKSICVLPELQIADTENCAGICSDFIVRYV